MIDLQIEHNFAGGVYARRMILNPGNWVQQHKHNYDHMSILAIGSVIVEADGEQKVYFGPTCIEIKAGTAHKVTAIEYSHWYCIHATDVAEADDEMLKEELVMK
jgi:quercetin dioxygenase-like cupin family protein